MKKLNGIEFYDKYDKVYSMIPDYYKIDNVKDKITYIQYREVKKWFDNHIGKENATPLNEIANKLGFSSSGNSIQFRNLVAELVEIEFYPIVSCPKGYYKAKTPLDITQNIETEVKRIKGIKRRINALNKMLEK